MTKCITKIINPCKCEVYTRTGEKKFKNTYVKIEYKNSNLRIRGFIAPLLNGNCLGSCGQCVDEIREGTPADGWTAEMLEKLCNVWDEWHLNDMRPYCQHMKELGWTKHISDKIKIETWTLTNDAIKMKENAKNRALDCLRNGQVFRPTKDETVYANMEYSIKVYNNEDISYKYGKLYRDAYELKKRDCLGHQNTEYKIRGQVSYADCDLGFLERPCPICGYKYGTAWLKEDVPEDVIAWFDSLPEATNRIEILKLHQHGSNF